MKNFKVRREKKNYSNRNVKTTRTHTDRYKCHFRNILRMYVRYYLMDFSNIMNLLMVFFFQTKKNKNNRKNRIANC